MESQENISTAESIILGCDSDFDSDLVIDEYLLAVDMIRCSQSDGQSSSVLQLAMSRLQDELSSLLLLATSPPPVMSSEDDDDVGKSIICTEDDASKHTDDDVSKHTNDDVGSRACRDDVGSRYVSASTITDHAAAADLRSIVGRLAAAGYRRECVQAYADVRKPKLESAFRSLGLERLSIEDVQRLEWESVERKIRRWIKAARVCIRIVFPSEKRLCQQIFRGLGADSQSQNNNDGSAVEADDLDDVCFMETAKEFAIQMFDFAEAIISVSQRSPEKLFKVLDLYDTLADLLPDVEAVFNSKLGEFVRVQAADILSSLAEAARGILSVFENKVLCEPSNVPIPGGKRTGT